MATNHDARVRLCANRLYAARRSRRAIPPVRHDLPGRDVTAAYRVQRRNIERLTAAGHRQVGRKIGLTSEAVQRQLGVDQPDFGVLLDSMDYSLRDVPLGAFIAPRIEAEFAFRLGEDLSGPDLDAAAVADRIECVAAAAEIVDSAIDGWDIDIVDTIADNASSAGFAVGPWRPFRADLDLRGARMRMTLDGAEISAGVGAATLGDPLAALAWLARAAIAFGDPLRRGDIILAGALGPMQPLTAGVYAVHIDGLPHLALRAVA